jgi:hypothetical protein
MHVCSALQIENKQNLPFLSYFFKPNYVYINYNKMMTMGHACTYPCCFSVSINLINHPRSVRAELIESNLLWSIRTCDWCSSPYQPFMGSSYPLESLRSTFFYESMRAVPPYQLSARYYGSRLKKQSLHCLVSWPTTLASLISIFGTFFWAFNSRTK